MWIALRLALAVVGYVARQLARRFRPATAGEWAGVPYAAKISKNKQRVVGFAIGMPRRSPTWIRMHKESDLDRWFKRLGIAEELQTGDTGFDALIYITCDHPAVAARLERDAGLREAVLEAFGAGYECVRFDGEWVWLERKASAPPDDEDLQLLARLHAASASIERAHGSQSRDPFLWKALAVEGLVWSIAGYALGVLPELFVHREDYHLSSIAMLPSALALAVAALAAMLFVVATWMRGSSRGHRVLVESALVLLLALPVTGFQVVADTNRALDDAPSQTTIREVTQCEQRVRRRRRGRRSSSYHVHLALPEDRSGPRLPRTLETSRALCIAAEASRQLVIEVGPGRWGHPWLRSLRTDTLTWTAP